MTICSVEGCERAQRARGWCLMHYKRWRKHGDPAISGRSEVASCSVDGCQRSAVARGLCASHHARWRRRGEVGEAIPSRLSVRERMAKYTRVSTVDGCHVWIGARDAHGYGAIQIERTVGKAHRIAYELARGAVPEGLELDHLCRHPYCVNPDHLEPVSHAENMRRARAAA